MQMMPPPNRVWVMGYGLWVILSMRALDSVFIIHEQ